MQPEPLLITSLRASLRQKTKGERLHRSLDKTCPLFHSQFCISLDAIVYVSSATSFFFRKIGTLLIVNWFALRCFQVLKLSVLIFNVKKVFS